MAKPTAAAWLGPKMEEAMNYHDRIVRDPADDAFLKPLIQSARSSQGPDSAARAEGDGGEAGYDVVLGEVETWLNKNC